MWMIWLGLMLIGACAIVVLGLTCVARDEEDDELRGTVNTGALGGRFLDNDDR
jgi:hypothetical protein